MRFESNNIRLSTKLILVLLVTVAASAGCSLFEPREAEDPGSANQVPWVPPTSLATALSNIERTIEAKSIINYERSLFDEFIFEPDAVDEVIIGSTFFENWGREDEVAAIRQIIDTEASIALKWTIRDSITVSAEESYYEDLGYELRFQSANLDTVFSGNADLYFRDDNGQWFVHRWVDKRDGSGNTTWGMLRRDPSLPE